MLEMTEDAQGILHVTATDKVSRDDIQTFRSRFEEIVEAEGPVRMKIELEDFKGWDSGGLWEDIKFDFAHRESMERVAIIGDKAWQDWGTWLAKPFFKAEIRFFPREDLAKAEAWLSEK